MNPSSTDFRRSIRDFLCERLPERLRYKTRNFLPLDQHDFIALHRILDEKGWAAPSWPREYGGPGWTARERLIFEEELGAAGAPRLYPHINMIGPVLQKYGTQAQKDRFLPGMARLDTIWCQGYSEPGSGSDLASLKTQCVREGDHYVVNGQKIWTSYAHWSDWLFCLVRTRNDGKPQEGISFLLIDMKTPGLTVRRIPTINGASDLNEVFFDNVKVPLDCLVHRENEGWTVAKYLLGFERTAAAAVVQCRHLLGRLRDLARQPRSDGIVVWNDPAFRDSVTRSEIDLRVQEQALQSVLDDDVLPQLKGAEISALKLQGERIALALSTLLMRCAGPEAMVFPEFLFSDPPVVDTVSSAREMLGVSYLDWRKCAIYGGTTEIQKNLIARAILD